MTKTRKIPVTLPDKLSDLLDLAVTDAIAASRKPGIRLDMSIWAEKARGPGKGASVCSVGMAGAVMTQTPGLRPTSAFALTPFHTPFEDQLLTINHMRMGDFRAPWDAGMMQQAAVYAARRVVLDAYNERTGRAPWRVYRKAAAMLRGVGL